jgi:hypothetical protein
MSHLTKARKMIVRKITESSSTMETDWGTLVPRINVENGIKLGILLE